MALLSPKVPGSALAGTVNRRRPPGGVPRGDTLRVFLRFMNSNSRILKPDYRLVWYNFSPSPKIRSQVCYL